MMKGSHMYHRKQLKDYFLSLSILLFSSLSAYVSAEGVVDERDGRIHSNVVRYVEMTEQRTLAPDTSTQDAKDLGNSIEFEVYTVNEESASRSVYLSAAGICRGFDGDYGVDFTNFTNHYINQGDDSQYYGGITGASIYRERGSDNMQYVPVYAIKNPQLEQEIRQREMTKTKDIVKDNVYSGKELLDKTICKPGKK